MGWVSVLIWAGSIIVAWLTAPKPPKFKEESPDLKAFNAPTAEEGRAIPVIFGKQKIEGSNVVWWGDLGTYDTTKYQAGIHQIYCLSPIDSVTAIWDGSEKYDVNYTENTVSSELDKSSSYYGDLYIEFGEPNQEVNEYLEAYADNTGETNPLAGQVGYIPAFRGFLGTIFPGNGYNGWIGGTDSRLGTSPTPNYLSLEATRINRQADYTEQWLLPYAEVGSNGAMNAVHIIREALTSKVWGLGISSSLIGATFETYAILAYNEGFGLACTLDRGSTQVNDFIMQVCDYLDGFVYQDENGYYQINLARDNYDLDGLTTYDEDEIVEISNFTRGTPYQMTNQVALTYTDSSKWKKVTSYAHDLAGVLKQGAVISTAINREWIVDEDLAVKMANRELKVASSQLAKATVKANRYMSVLNPGDVFKLNWSDLGLVGIVFRVVGVDRGKYDDGTVELSIIEDVFSLGQGLYAPPGSTDYDSALNDPFQSANIFVDEMPYWIWQNESYVTPPPTSNYGLIMTMQSQPSAEVLNYQQWVDVSGTYTRYEDANFAYYNSLLNELGYTQEDNIGLRANIDDDITVGATVYIIVQDTDYGNYEIMQLVSVNQANKTMNVKRGCLDTVPQYHPSSSTVWFASQIKGVVLTEFNFGDQDVKLLNQSALGSVLLADADENTKTLAKRYELPYRPKYLRIGKDSTGHAPIGTPTEYNTVNNYGIIEIDYDANTYITWKHADRTDATTMYDAFDTTSETPEANQEYTLVFYKPGDTLFATAIRTITGITTEQYTYLRDGGVFDEQSDFVGYWDKWMKVITNRDGYDSFQEWIVAVSRAMPLTVSTSTTSGIFRWGLYELDNSFAWKVIVYEVSGGWDELPAPTYETSNISTSGQVKISGQHFIKARSYDPKTGTYGAMITKYYREPYVNYANDASGYVYAFDIRNEDGWTSYWEYTTNNTEPATPTTASSSGSGWTNLGTSEQYFWIKVRAYNGSSYTDLVRSVKIENP